jgi:hypothetical protein
MEEFISYNRSLLHTIIARKREREKWRKSYRMSSRNLYGSFPSLARTALISEINEHCFGVENLRKSLRNLYENRQVSIMLERTLLRCLFIASA